MITDFQISFQHILISILSWGMILIIAYKNSGIIYKESQDFDFTEEYFNNDNKIGLLLFLLVSLFCTFACCGGDFLHYKIIYDQNLESFDSIHVETIYYWLIQTLPENYYLWRFCIWGVASILLYIIIYKLNYGYAWSYFCFSLLALTYFINPRYSLGFMILYLGLIYVIGPQNDRLSRKWILGLILMTFSIFFHTTQVIFLCVTIFAILPGTKNLKFIVVSLLLFPILYRIIGEGSFWQYLLLEYEDDLMEKSLFYLTSDYRVATNILGYLKLIVNRTPIIIIFIWGLRRMLSKEKEMTYISEVLITSSYFLFYISCLFYENSVSAYLSQRFWDAALYPLTFFAIIELKNNFSDFWIRLSFCLLLLSNIYNLAYSLYSIDRFNQDALEMYINAI